MHHAGNYATWHEAAQELDRYEGLETWREEDESSLYDYPLIRRRLTKLRNFRKNDDIAALMHFLRQGMHWNIGNIGNPALHERARTGTKYLIQDYLDEVCVALNYVCDDKTPDISLADKIEFFQDAALAFGRSALMLSGGATMGFFHVGVVKALWQEGLLPKVLSGSSAGAIVASRVGCQNPDEVEQELFDPESLHYTFWKMLPLMKMWQRGVVMEQNQLRGAIEEIVPDLTFSETYERSSHVLNIAVSPSNVNQHPRLLNYLTFPHLYIREAVLASCAVPFVFPPVRLVTRDADGKKIPFQSLLKWEDGSMKSDLPALRLRRLHNVNHTIVSQTNPHILPFMQANPPHAKGHTSEAKELLMSNAQQQASYALNLGRRYAPFERVRHRLDQAHAILDQKYTGNVTIIPRFKMMNYLRLAANPTQKELADYIFEGERSVWPRMSMIKNQSMVSRTFDACLERLQARNDGRRRADRRSPKLRVVR